MVVNKEVLQKRNTLYKYPIPFFYGLALLTIVGMTYFLKLYKITKNFLFNLFY